MAGASTAQGPGHRVPLPVVLLAVAILLLLALAVLALRSGAPQSGTSQAGTSQAGSQSREDAAGEGVGDDATSPDGVEEATGSTTAEAASERSTGPAPAASSPDGPIGGPAPEVAGGGGGSSTDEAPPAGGGAPLPAGTCIVDDGRGADVTSVEVIECQVEHTGEVFAATTIARPAEAGYPGEDVLLEETRRLCLGSAFEDYVGVPYDSSGLFVYALMPTADTWVGGDRDVACVAYDITGPLDASVRDSGA